MIDTMNQEPGPEPEDLPPLNLPLPSPPIVRLNRVPCILEYVPIHKLDAWARERNLVRKRTAFLGKPGWRPTEDEAKVQWAGLGHVALFWPESWAKEQS